LQDHCNITAPVCADISCQETHEQFVKSKSTESLAF
jgi:hypothetical protein